MKRIYFVRHAKSSWSNALLDDIDRPLNPRGKRDAPFMAQKLSERVSSIQFACISPAKRARRTARHFIDEFKPIKKEIIDKIYHGSVKSLIEVMHELPDEVASAMVFGHNPSFTSLHNRFADHPLDNLPTCGIFELIADTDSWVDVEPTNTRVGFVIYPKMFDR